VVTHLHHRGGGSADVHGGGNRHRSRHGHTHGEHARRVLFMGNTDSSQMKSHILTYFLSSNLFGNILVKAKNAKLYYMINLKLLQDFCQNIFDC
jgi:hypothetical protein